MALTVGELQDALENLDSKYWGKVAIVYYSDSDVELKVSGVEVNFDTDASGDVLLIVED